MVVWLYISLFLSLFSPPASAGIFKDEEGLNASRERAKPLQEHIFPGKIIATEYLNETSWLDYASAFPVGKPGDTKTRVVVSSAHTYLTSTDYSARRYYCDYQGNRYEIENVILYQDEKSLIKAKEGIRYAENDIVLYYLKEPIACNPLNDIPKDPAQHISLTTLTYGWTIVAPENGGIVENLEGSCSFSFDNEFEYIGDAFDYSRNTYVYKADADRVVSLADFLDDTKWEAYYLASTVMTESKPQIYCHDSGAPWFTKNLDGGYSLTALTSRVTPVVVNHEERVSPIKGVLSEKNFDWQDDARYTLRFFELKQRHPVQTTLTPLAPHRDWIFKHC